MKKRVIAWLAALIILISAIPDAIGASDSAVTLTTLKLRKEPSATAKVLDTYKKGTEVTVLEMDGDWVKVRVGKRTGYMMAEYLDIPEDLEIPDREEIAASLAAPGRTDFRPEPGQSLCDTAYLLDEGQEPVITSSSYQTASGADWRTNGRTARRRSPRSPSSTGPSWP